MNIVVNVSNVRFYKNPIGIKNNQMEKIMVEVFRNRKLIWWMMNDKI